MSSVTVRVDEATKVAATALVEDFGMDLSTVIRAFLRQVVRENRIPLNLSYPEPNEESLTSIKEAEEILASGQSRFASKEDMYKALGI